MRYRETDPYTQPYAPRPPLARRLGRFFGLMGALFAIAMAVIITQRLSHDSLALLIGLSCGVMAMLPTLALGIFIWRREDARRHDQGQRQSPYPASPPVIVVSPQALPGYGPQTGYGQSGPSYRGYSQLRKEHSTSWAATTGGAQIETERRLV